MKYHQLSKVQQRTLILYCEQDIHNYSRQAIAFSLLKAILGRKLQLPELNAVMEKVARISITADIDNVRLQARQVSYIRITVTTSPLIFLTFVYRVSSHPSQIYIRAHTEFLIASTLKPRLSGSDGTRGFPDKPNTCKICDTIIALIQCYAIVLSPYI